MQYCDASRIQLQDHFVAQTAVNIASNDLVTNPIYSTFKLAVSDAVAKRQSTEVELEIILIESTDLLKSYKGINEETVR